MISFGALSKARAKPKRTTKLDGGVLGGETRPVKMQNARILRKRKTEPAMAGLRISLANHAPLRRPARSMSRIRIARATRSNRARGSSSSHAISRRSVLSTVMPSSRARSAPDGLR